MRKKIPLTLVAAIVIGLVVAGASSLYLFRYASSQQPTDRAPVPNRDILAYEEITLKDLEWRTIPAGGFEPGAAKTPEEIVGKIAMTTLYKGEQIRLERLTGRAEFDASQQLIAVNVDLTRSGGGNINPGDLVDVYWLEGGQVPGSLVARDAVVISVRDAQGRLIAGQAGGSGISLLPEGQTPPLPAVATLAVKPAEVGLTVRGAWGDSANIVLVKKFRPLGAASASGLGQQTNESEFVPAGEGVSGGPVPEAGE